MRERFPRRIAELEEEEYSSEEETDMEEEPDDSQGAFDAYAEALPANEPSEAVNRMNELITHFPFLGTNYRSEEQDALENIMNGLTQHVRMLGVFPESAQFQSTVDAGQMGAILMEQWYNIWNQTSAYEGEAEMEEVHSSMTNQSEFFQALTRAILAGHRREFWRINAQQRLDLQVAINFNDPRSHATASLRRRGGKRKKKTRRKRRGKKRKTRKKRGGAVTQFIVKNDQVNINAFFNEIRTRQIDGSYVEHSPSDELGLEHLHRVDWEDYTEILQKDLAIQMERVGDHCCIADRNTAGFTENSLRIRGYEEWYLDTLADQDGIDRLMQIILEDKIQYWDALIDWKGHETWIPATKVEIHTDGDPTAIGSEFTATTGYGPLALPDTMRVTHCAWDDGAGTGDCEVEKLGPVLTGRAGFTIEPTSETASEVVWIEDVKVRYLPRVLAPIAKVAGAAGFRLGMRKLGKQLATR